MSGEEVVVVGTKTNCSGGAEEEEEIKQGMLPLQVPVRVLLVEDDESTQKIITALLQKCGYKVATASDGLKAWEMLTDKAYHIDLVLAEVELPLISGFVLLTMLMEHETCKHIPVIMMSSHDSISTIFKCMLKGAADFLVKPIRKNELRNLWQHVWRRHYVKGSHGTIESRRDEHLAKPVNIEKKASNHSRDNAVCGQDSEYDSEKVCDAQSSCTRSEMHAESTYIQNMQEVTQKESGIVSFVGMREEKCRFSCPVEIMVCNRAEENLMAFDSQSTNGTKGDAKARIDIATGNDSPSTEECPDNIELASVTSSQTDNREISKQVLDLIGPMNNGHVHHNEKSKNAFPDGKLTCSANSMPSSSPLLELSLRREHHHPTCEQKGKDDSNALNHSNSSAFSLFNNKAVLTTSFTPQSSNTKDGESIARKGSDTCYVTRAHKNNDCGSDENQQHGLKSNCASHEDGMTFPPPFTVNPFHVPIMWQAGSPVMQPIFYMPSNQPPWSTGLSMWLGAVPGSSSNQYDPGGCANQDFPEKLDIGQTIPPANQTQSIPSPQGVVENAEQQNSVLSVASRIGSNKTSNGRKSPLESVASGGLLSNNTDSNFSKFPVERANNEGVSSGELLKPSCFTRMDQREVALAKFRLKRKDRCYEKKVRYESRKRLAEQRPRVKGQFVRQAQQSNSNNGEM